MNDITDYKKAVGTGNEPTGAIMTDNRPGKPTRTAVTVSAGKTSGPLKGSRKSYVRVRIH